MLLLGTRERERSWYDRMERTEGARDVSAHFVNIIGGGWNNVRRTN